MVSGAPPRAAVRRSVPSARSAPYTEGPIEIGAPDGERHTRCKKKMRAARPTEARVVLLDVCDVSTRYATVTQIRVPRQAGTYPGPTVYNTNTHV